MSVAQPGRKPIFRLAEVKLKRGRKGRESSYSNWGAAVESHMLPQWDPVPNTRRQDILCNVRAEGELS